MTLPTSSNYQHSPHSVVQKEPKQKHHRQKDNRRIDQGKDDYEYVYYYYYDYVYPEDVASFDDFENLPEPMKATGNNGTVSNETTTVAPPSVTTLPLDISSTVTPTVLDQQTSSGR